MEGVRNDAGTKGGSHPDTSLQKSKTSACFKAELHLDCECEALVSCTLAHSSAVPVSVTQRYQPTLFMFIHLPGPLCQQWMQLDLTCIWKADLHQPAFVPRRGFSTQGILASIVFASTTSTTLGILPWNCCSPFLHPQWIPSKGQCGEIGEWLSLSKWVVCFFFFISRQWLPLRFRIKVQRFFRVSQYWIILAFMHQNKTKWGGKKIPNQIIAKQRCLRGS